MVVLDRVEIKSNRKNNFIMALFAGTYEESKNAICADTCGTIDEIDDCMSDAVHVNEVYFQHNVFTWMDRVLECKTMITSQTSVLAVFS